MSDEMSRVLVVDDDPAILEVVVEILREFGYDVDTAANGAEALQRVEEERPDAVLLDLMMPVMDGWSFVRECRQRPSIASLPIGIMSAARQAASSARDMAVQVCLSKPFELDALLDAVEELISHAESGVPSQA